jgi:2-succinyl-6-hydroxy-2,4-cyclohexadiene-1-carboxylate synthase
VVETMLAVRRFASGPPVVALHGFTFTGEQFATTGVGIRRTVIAPDLPGHGGSRDASTSIHDVVAAVAELIDSIGVAVPLVGYSQGGRIALLNAVSYPNLISTLVLVSATAGIEDVAQRRARADADVQMAAALRATALEDFLDSWTSSGITSTSHLTTAESRADRHMRRDNTPSGLADAVVGYGQGAQPSVWDSLSALSMPVLIVSGIQDQKYCDIGRRMARQIPQAESVVIEASGHNPFLDAPESVHREISNFLDRNS